MQKISTRSLYSTLDILIIASDGSSAIAYYDLCHAVGWRVVCTTPPLLVAAQRPIRARAVLLCGWETVQSLTSAPVPLFPRNTVAIALGDASAEEENAAFDRGIDFIIELPCSPTVLICRLRAALRWSRPVGSLRGLAPYAVPPTGSTDDAKQPPSYVPHATDR